MKKLLPFIILLFAVLIMSISCSENPSADSGVAPDINLEPAVQKYTREYWGEWKKMDQTETWEITSTWIKVNGKYLSRDVVLAKPSENVISVTDGKITYCLYAVRTASSLISGSVESDDGARGVGGWLPVVVQNINDRFDVTETTTNGEGVFSADKLIPGDEYKITIGDTSLTVTPSFDGEDIGNITLRDGVNFKVSLSNGNDIMFAGSDYYSMNLIIENIGDANCTAATYSLTADEGLEFINSYSEGVLLRTVAAGEKKTIPLRVRCNIPETETAIRKLHLTITDRNGTTWNDSVSLKFYKNTITINVISENGRPISGVIIGEGRTYSITNKTNYSIEVPVSPESYLMVFSGAIANASSNTEAAYSIGLDCPAIEADELLKELGTDVNNFEPNDDEIHAQTLLLGKSMVAYLFENDIDYYYLEPFHEWDEGRVIREATCTEDGLKVSTCLICGRTAELAIPATGHDWDEGKVTKEATCTEDGLKVSTCSVCGKTEEIAIPSLGHSCDEGTVVKPATCGETGLKMLTCLRCGAQLEEILPTTAHSFDEDNWTSDSDYHWHASVCGHDVIDGKAAHTWVQSSVKAATCTTTGSITYQCSVCNASKTETISTLGHKWDEGVITKAATCTETGTKTFTCSVCSETRTESIPATGHSFSSEWTSDSSYHWHAATCGHSDVKDKASHTWVYYSGTSATCTTSGSATYRCSVCGATKTETLAATGHKWNSGVVVTSPTCTTTGTKKYTCTNCSATKSETIAALGHSFSNAWTSDSDYHWHVSTCGHDVISGKASHSWNSGVVTVQPTYNSEGVKTYTCTVCGRTRTESISFEFTVGSIGPAGGWVFYDKGSYSNGWRYLEAAPKDLDKMYQWGDDGIFDTLELIGWGKQNTETIANNSTIRIDNAAKACLDYTVNGYDDWFLPSISELNKMYVNLYKKNLGGFRSNDYYMSSSEKYENYNYDTHGVWNLLFTDGSKVGCTRSNSYRVRPIRAF